MKTNFLPLVLLVLGQSVAAQQIPGAGTQLQQLPPPPPQQPAAETRILIEEATTPAAPGADSIKVRVDELQTQTTSAENAVRFQSAFFQIDVTDCAPRVRAPTLVLHARDDAVIPFEEGRVLSSLIPDARLVPLEGRNHVIQEDEPAWPIFLAEVRNFLGAAGSEAEPIVTREPFPELTDRERDVLELIAQGTDNAQIAGRLQQRARARRPSTRHATR